MKNIHILPTEESGLWFYKGIKDFLLTGLTVNRSTNIDPQHIYITSDEEIKEGDWVYDETSEELVYQVNVLPIPKEYPWQKIILTNNPQLIADGVQEVSEEFLEWFVENPNTEFVKITHTEVWRAYELGGAILVEQYRIIIPQEENLQEYEEEVECNTCGYLMDLLSDNSIYVCNNSECTSCYEEGEEDTYLHGFINQFGDGELGELDPNEWNALEFLEWLKLNNYEIIKKIKK